MGVFHHVGQERQGTPAVTVRDVYADKKKKCSQVEGNEREGGI